MLNAEADRLVVVGRPGWSTTEGSTPSPAPERPPDPPLGDGASWPITDPEWSTLRPAPI